MFGHHLECGSCNQTFSCGKDSLLQQEIEKLNQQNHELLEELEELKQAESTWKFADIDQRCQLESLKKQATEVVAAELKEKEDKLKAREEALVEREKVCSPVASSKAKSSKTSTEGLDDSFSVKGSNFSFYKDGSFLVEMADDKKAEQVGDTFVEMLENAYPEDLDVYQRFRKYHDIFSGLLGL